MLVVFFELLVCQAIKEIVLIMENMRIALQIDFVAKWSIKMLLISHDCSCNRSHTHPVGPEVLGAIAKVQ